MEPIMEFQSEQEAYACLHEWQERLFLNDWIIKLEFSDCIVDENGQELAGQNQFQIVGHSCSIRLLNSVKNQQDYISKVCHEKVLVHELLHCKYNWLCPPETMEGKYFDELEHSLLEQMAKSLIMAKYKIPFNWFQNFEIPKFCQAGVSASSAGEACTSVNNAKESETYA